MTEIRDELNKKFGGYFKGSEITNSKRALIPVSPAIDIGLNGGLLTGTVSIFAGTYKTGKTTTAIQAMRNAGNVYNFPCFYMDIEGRGQERIISQVAGLKKEDFLWKGTTREYEMDAEDYLDQTEEIIKTYPNAFIILDSISRLYSKPQREKEVSGIKRAPNSKILSDFVSRTAGMIAAMNTTLICIAQAYDNVGATTPHAKKTKISGGNAIQYQNDTSLVVQYRQDYMTGGKIPKRIGNILKWDVQNVPFGSVPTNDITSYIRFGHGCDDIKEVMDMAIDLKLIEVSKSWYELNGKKMQGADAVYKHLSENPDEYDKLWSTIKLMCLDHDLLKTVCKTKEEFEKANLEVYGEDFNKPVVRKKAKSTENGEE